MDGAAKGGGAISAVAATNTPIVYIGTGEHMLDIERFVPNSFVSKLLGMGDMQGLMEHVQSLKLDQKDSMKHIMEGVFTVRDLRDQLSNVRKMGPLSKMAGMIPGLSGMMGAMDDEEGGNKMKRMICICDSMTVKELDSDGKIFVDEPSRMTRVARGSGTSVREVEELLTQHRTMAGMLLNPLKQHRANIYKGMAKNAKAGMANMSKAQAQLKGGNQQQKMAALQQRMASMGRGAGGAGGGGMPDMSSMLKMLGGGAGGGGMPDMSSLMGMLGGGGAGPSPGAGRGSRR